jgi:hypothetical protein
MNFLISLKMGIMCLWFINQEAKMLDCFSFLKAGLDNDEFLFIMMDSAPKDEI